MKNTSFVIIFFLILLGYNSSAQSTADTIQYKDKVYLYQGYPLSMRMYDSLLQISNNDVALEYFEKGRKNSRIGLISTYAGSLFLGYTLGDLIFSGGLNARNITTAGLTVAAFGISIPCNRAFNKHIENSFDAFNEKVKQTESDTKSLNIGFTPTGIGARFNF